MTDGTIALTGVLRRVTFEREETGFRVVKIEFPGEGLVTVAGVMPPLAPDAEVRVVGRRVVDPKFGPQIKAEAVTTITPTTRVGLERFLASGMVRGIGPALAKRVVDHFGDKTFSALDDGGERLSEVRGIGTQLARAAGAAWSAQRGPSAAMIFLQGHGIGPGLAMRIVKRYGARTEIVTKTEPYLLAQEVAGVGFLTADRIAQACGIARDAPERMGAGVVHMMNVVCEAGHTLAPRTELVARAASKLGAPLDLVDAAVDRVAQAGAVVLLGAPGEESVAPRILHDAESDLAAGVFALLTARSKPLGGVDEAIKAFEGRAGVTLAEAQRAAVAAAARHKVLIVTGGPGVGKTTLVRALLDLFSRAKLEVRLAAPTGRAAKRMSEATSRPALTLHRLLEVDPRTGRFVRCREAPLEGGAFIVDEASMIDVALARSLVDALPMSARLVLVGDTDQLPSVGPGAVLHDLLSSGAVPAAHLSHIFRQGKGSLIVEAAHAVRAGTPPVSATDDTGDFFVVPRDDPAKARATVVDLVTNRIPKRFGLDPLRDIQVLSPMHKGGAGVATLNEELARVLNPSTGPAVGRAATPIRAGDKVMQLKNDYERDVYNGDTGIVKAVDPASRTVRATIDDRLIDYDEKALDSLALAYAITIHKSQGSEYPAVVIPWLRDHFVMLSRNLLYTAITRGKRLVVLVADPRALKVALAEDRREQRNTQLAVRLQEHLRSGAGELLHRLLHARVLPCCDASPQSVRPSYRRPGASHGLSQPFRPFRSFLARPPLDPGLRGRR